jgi:hypothetical protein
MSDGIFIGTFTSADGTNSNFKVEETLKGEVDDVIYVSASMVGSSCYEPFYRGRRYLILADRTQSGWITNPHCGTFILANNQSVPYDLDFLFIKPSVQATLEMLRDHLGLFRPHRHLRNRYQQPSKAQSMPAESKSKASAESFYMVQAGAYSDPGQAERMKARLALAGFEPSVQHISVQGQGDFYRVRVGPYSSMDLMETANRERKAESKEFNPLPKSRAPPHQK